MSFSVPSTSFFNDVKICVTSYFMSIGKPRVSPLLSLNTSAVIRYFSEIFNEGGIKIISLSNIRPIIIYFHSSQCRLIPYLHQRPIFFKANSIHSSINKILVRKAQKSVENYLVYQSVSQKSILCDVYFITLNFMILI
jgi:hypothetical protein